MPDKFYPSVSSIISLDDLPQELNFIQVGLNSVFDHVYFRDLQFTRSPKGDSAYYSLILILNRSVGVTIPGADIRLAINPNFTSGTTTEIPITLEYEWKLLAILKKIKKFTTGGFSFSADAFFELLTDITGITKEALLQSALEQFVNAPDPLSAITVFVTDANTKYGISVTPPTSTNFAEALAEAILTVSIAAAKLPFVIIYEMYIETIGSAEEALDKVKAIFAPFFDKDPIEYVKEILVPKINATLSLAPAGIGIIFPRKYLTPLDPLNSLQPFPETGAATDKMSILGFGLGTFSFSTVTGFGYDEQLTATLNYPSMIGNTGLIVNLQNAKLDLSRKKNIIEAVQDGRPDDFMGVYIQEVSITLPEKWFKQADHTTAMIYGRRLLIGTGGLSGEIGLEATTAGLALPPGQKPAIKVRLGENDGFEIGFQKFSLTFKQNAITGCDIKGYLKIKGFKDAANNDAQIDIKVHISDNGDFSITASEEQGISLIKIPGIVNVNIKSLTIGRKTGKIYVAISGTLDFADQTTNSNGGFIKDNLPKDIEIQKLLIWQDGSFEFEGGGIELRKPLTLKLGPVALSITAIHFGSHEQEHNGIMRKYKFFGFDGGVSIKPGGVDARGDGIKFYFTVDNGPGKPLDVFMRIQSIAIDLMIPGTATPETAAVIMKGYLAMKSPPNSSGSGSSAATEYAGSIELTLPKLKIAGSAAMRYNPSVPSFIIDIGLELPSAIPLGSTGLGIYGFRGLFGLRYVANREYVGLPADAEWWQYYKKKVAPDNKEGIFINKMQQKEGFSVGAGVSLSTLPDGGRTFSTKLFFMLSLPDVFLLQGQAAILSKRIGLNDTNDPPFFALIAISSTSVEAALGVNYQIPNSGSDAGKVVKVTGVLELAFFWGNSFSWYLNLGRETPEDRRIRARIFNLFDCYFFLMISSEGIYTGAGASYSFNKSFLGVVKVKLAAYLDIRGKISFKPLQVGGSIQLGASLEIKVFGVGFGLSADAGLAAEAPKPFIISGFIKVKFKVLWKTFSFNVDFTWNFNNQLDLSEIPVIDEVITNMAKAINAHTKEAFPILIQKLASTAAALPTLSALNAANIEAYTVPQDSFIDIEFKQGMHATGADPSLAKFNDINSGFQYTVMVPPQKGKSSQVKHEFFVDKVELKIWNPIANTWSDYNPFKAMSPLADLPNLNISPYATFDQYVDAQNLKYGSWQVRQPNRYNVLRVLATNPLSYMTQGVPFVPEELQITSETIFCSDPPREKICVNLSNLGRINGNDKDPVFVPAYQSLLLEGVLFRLIGNDGRIVVQTYGSLSRALRLLSGESLEIYPPEAISYSSLQLQMTTINVNIAYYKSVQTGFNSSSLPVFGWQLVQVDSKNQNDLLNPVEYSNTNQAIGKIVITAGRCADKNACVYFDDRAIRLEEFLNSLIKINRIGNGRLIRIYPRQFNNMFDPFFKLGALWDTPPTGSTSVQSKFNEDFSIYILLTSSRPKWSCEFNLIPEPRIDLSKYKIIRFFNLKADPNTTGSSDFTVSAEVLIDGVARIINFKGRSCVILRECKTVIIRTPIKQSASKEKMMQLLQWLAAEKRLVQTRKLNVTSGKYAKTFGAVKEIGLFENKTALYYEAEQISSNDLSLQFRFDNKQEYILLVTEGKETEKELPISGITKFDNLRLDEEKQASDERYYFLIDAFTQKTKITLKGETSIPIFEREEKVIPIKANEFDCGELTKEALALPAFIENLANLNHLLSSTPIRLVNFEEYRTTYFDTPLFPKGMNVKLTTWQMLGKPTSFRSVDFNLINGNDKQQFTNCLFHLEVVSTNLKLDLTHLVKVYNIMPFPQNGQEGPTYHFRANALFIYEGKEVEAQIIGYSCYPIAICESKKCQVLVYRFCYLSEVDHQYNQTIPNISVVQQNNQSMAVAMSKLIQPIWRPQSVFAIRIHTRDRLTAGGNLQAEYSNAYFIGFKTAGPLGHFHKYLNLSNVDTVRTDYSTLLAADKEEEFKLSNLKFYVDMDKSYPNADGRLTLAKPLFYRNPRLLLFFNKDYVYGMYADWNAYEGNQRWDSNLRASIIDPTDNPDNPSVFYVDAEWEKNEVPYITTDQSVLTNFLANGVVCTTNVSITKFGLNTSFIIPELIPLKTYAARFNARFKRHTSANYIEREAHRYVFATSRYATFEEQVNSYITLTEYDVLNPLLITHQEKAFYDIPLTLTPADVTRAQSVLNGTDTDTLKTKFIHVYDRLMDGGLLLEAQEAAITTEFNCVKNTSTNQILGILIKNPEPFNDPKIPVATLNSKKMIELSVNGGASNVFKCVYSKDVSCIFVTNANNALNMPTGNYVFTFRYLEYNPNIRDYIVVNTVSSIALTVS